MSVSKEDAKRRLNYLRAQMLRAIFGNSWKRKGGKIVFLILKQGSRATSNQAFSCSDGDRGRAQLVGVEDRDGDPIH